MSYVRVGQAGSAIVHQDGSGPAGEPMLLDHSYSLPGAGPAGGLHLVAAGMNGAG